MYSLPQRWQSRLALVLLVAIAVTCGVLLVVTPPHLDGPAPGHHGVDHRDAASGSVIVGGCIAAAIVFAAWSAWYTRRPWAQEAARATGERD